MPKVVLGDNPLLIVLGRRGRGAVVDALVTDAGPWNLRALARAAGVPHQVAGRAVRELEALGVVEVLRPGRDLEVRWRATPGARFLATLQVPDLHLEAARRFAGALPRERLVRWWRPGDRGDPAAPVRIAVLHAPREDPADVLERLNPGLDAVASAGLPKVDAMPLSSDALESEDPIVGRVRAGVRLTTGAPSGTPPVDGH